MKILEPTHGILDTKLELKTIFFCLNCLISGDNIATPSMGKIMISRPVDGLVLAGGIHDPMVTLSSYTSHSDMIRHLLTIVILICVGLGVVYQFAIDGLVY